MNDNMKLVNKMVTPSESIKASAVRLHTAAIGPLHLTSPEIVLESAARLREELKNIEAEARAVIRDRKAAAKAVQREDAKADPVITEQHAAEMARRRAEQARIEAQAQPRPIQKQSRGFAFLRPKAA